MFKVTTLFSIIALFAFSACSNTSTKSVNVPHQRDTNTPLINTSISNSVSNSSNSYEILAYVNSIRAKGAKCAPPAPPLQSNYALERAAIAHTKDMAINHFLRHDGSGTEIDVAKPKNALYSNFVDRVTYYGYPVKPNILVGENITYTLFKNIKSKRLSDHYKKAVDNWLHDEAHCKILMNPRFNYAGVGYQKVSDRYYFTMDFAERSE